jgi:hypothetical protein
MSLNKSQLNNDIVDNDKGDDDDDDDDYDDNNNNNNKTKIFKTEISIHFPIHLKNKA